jgi:prevent-host-death family protein
MNVATSRMTRIDKPVSAGDAGRHFSKLLRTVQDGRTVLVTKHGKPVARIIPVVGENRAAEGARSALFARLKRQQVVEAGHRTREDGERLMHGAMRTDR